ncbi:Vascular endothelial growth factor receptor 1 like protein [Argiope bruennichi]|uniref:receptor protein-tyrosine kinase n=1 Tax=Argiope bruennichi TaxID=94029 RepID=A0A8T0F2W4_ARGBR|nr:Vascular endothelial growth factor receptor 1 like protein [Argiope bruennichi]
MVVSTHRMYEAKLEGPKLNISEDFIDVPLNSTLYIQCTGQMPMSWKYRDPKVSTKKYQDVKAVSDTNESDGVFKSVVQLFFTSYEETGEYVCYYNDLSTSVYIFVNDESHLLLPLDTRRKFLMDGRQLMYQSPSIILLGHGHCIIEVWGASGFVDSALVVRIRERVDNCFSCWFPSAHSVSILYNYPFSLEQENPQEPVVTFTEGLENIVKSRTKEVDLIATYTVFPLTTDIRSLWIKDNAQLSPANNKYKIRSSSSEFRLSISNLTKLDSGFYTVAAHTSGGYFNKSFHLRVKDTPSIKIKNVTTCCFVPSHSYQLQCESKGFPSPTLFWSWADIRDCTSPSCDKNKKWKYVDELTDINNHTQWFMNIDEENVWSLLNVTAITSGYYKCVSQNEMGFAEEVVPFIVSDVKNGFDMEIENNLPLELSPFSMTCRASSDLYEDLFWTWTPGFTNESSPIQDDLLTRSNTSNSIALEMNLEKIFLNNSGIYKCLATPRFGDKLEEKTTYINVQKIQEPQFENGDWDTELLAAANSILELDCVVNGTPLPKVTWYRNGELLTSNFTGGKFEEDFQVLIISRLVDEDSGDYACIAENVAGAIMRNMSLSIISSGVSGHVTQGISEPIHVGVLAAAGICVATILILLLLFARWLYKRKHTLMKLQGFNHQLFQEGHFGIYDPNMPIDEQVDLLPYDNRWEFPKENLKFGRTLGQGAFGRVVKAEAFGLNDYEKSTTVAVKMLKERADINQQRALSAELKILIHLGHHVNIVNLMGAVTKNIEKGELLVMVEYCKYGNLRNYLLRHRDKFVNETDLYNRSPVPLSDSPPLDSGVTCFTEVRFDTFMSSSGSGSTVFAVDNPNYRQRVQSIVSSDPKGSCSSHIIGRSMSCSSSNDSRYYCRVDSQEHVITTSDLLCFAFQSACGMDYLASRKLIHRDLAARNVLLAEDKVVKICDFGLAKDCYKYENYVKKGDGPLPIKWMAVESIRDHVFTTKSDVWSFGILMWEFFTLGSNPYPGIEIDEEFYKRLNAGFRMERPDYCPEDVYDIMKDCWLANPDDRPDFSQIADTLGGLMETGVKQHYIDLNAPYLEMNNKLLTHNYLNMPSNECQITPTRLYMNSDTSNSFLYDNLPPSNRPVLDASVRDEVLEDIPMIQLDITEEKHTGQTFKQQDNYTHPSDYLQMGDNFSAR